MDRELLTQILDAHETSSHFEMLALVRARARLRRGDDPAEVLDWLEAQRAPLQHLAEMQREQGLSAVFARITGRGRQR